MTLYIEGLVGVKPSVIAQLSVTMARALMGSSSKDDYVWGSNRRVEDDILGMLIDDPLEILTELYSQRRFSNFSTTVRNVARS